MVMQELLEDKGELLEDKGELPQLMRESPRGGQHPAGSAPTPSPGSCCGTACISPGAWQCCSQSKTQPLHLLLPILGQSCLSRLHFIEINVSLATVPL